MDIANEIARQTNFGLSRVLDCFRYAPNATEWSARQIELETRTVEQYKGRSAFGNSANGNDRSS